MPFHRPVPSAMMVAHHQGGSAVTLDEHVLSTLIGEMRRLKALGDKALAQVNDDDTVNAVLDNETNSLAIIIKHVSGNMRSRWTDFLSSDGEKATRDRDGEFDQGTRWTVEQARTAWNEGWQVTLGSLDALTPADLMKTITIRGEALTVTEAITRQIAHYAQHTGQMLILARHFVGAAWVTPSIPRGQSKAGTWAYKNYGKA
jgi:hypothetical protein